MKHNGFTSDDFEHFLQLFAETMKELQLPEPQAVRALNALSCVRCAAADYIKYIYASKPTSTSEALTTNGHCTTCASQYNYHNIVHNAAWRIVQDTMIPRYPSDFILC